MATDADAKVCAMMPSLAVWRRRIGNTVDPFPADDLGTVLTMMRSAATAAAIDSGHRLAGKSKVSIRANHGTGFLVIGGVPVPIPAMPDVATFVVMTTPLTCRDHRATAQDPS